MRNLALPIGILFVAIAAGVVLFMLPGKTEAPSDTQNTGQLGTTTPTGNEGAIAGIPDLILVGTPTKHMPVTSPITITGSARGTWYFEASFPIELRDASGKIIAQHYAEAQSDWMTENFVPFKASLTYPAQPAGSTGTLVLKNDNPSGDPARDKKVEIPIVFQ